MTRCAFARFMYARKRVPLRGAPRRLWAPLRGASPRGAASRRRYSRRQSQTSHEMVVSTLSPVGPRREHQSSSVASTAAHRSASRVFYRLISHTSPRVIISAGSRFVVELNERSDGHSFSLITTIVRSLRRRASLASCTADVDTPISVFPDQHRSEGPPRPFPNPRAHDRTTPCRPRRWSRRRSSGPGPSAASALT